MKRLFPRIVVSLLFVLWGGKVTFGASSERDGKGARALLPAMEGSPPGEPQSESTTEELDTHRSETLLADAPVLLLILGAPGAPEFAEVFAKAGLELESACARAGVAYEVIGRESTGAGSKEQDDRTRIEELLRGYNQAFTQPVWVVYLGHGTWDGRDARLNLRGPDASADDFARWLDGYKRPLIFVHGGSSSGPFVPKLSAPGRVVISATENGDEVNHARFGALFASALGASAADIDQDGTTSVLEAFVSAAHEAQSFYEESGRLATEHALIDDNGDARGTPAEWFRGTRTEKKSDDGTSPDGSFAHRLALVENPIERLLTSGQRTRRDALEADLEVLRGKKPDMPIDRYLLELEKILRQLGSIYADAGARSGS